jgi:AraC-like DNA-binding protein
MASPELRSRTYAPSPELSGYIARHYVFSASLPSDVELTECLLAETAFVRILLAGDWLGETAPGVWSNPGPALFFGPNANPFRVRVRGSFRVLGMALRPSGWRGLSDISAKDHVDRMVPLAELWGARADALLGDVSAIDSDDDEGDAAVVAALERHVAALLDERGRKEPDRAMQRFERIARNESTALVREVADRLGLGQRSFERRCVNSFGMGPKAVLRRSRFLDMASAIRGLTDLGEHPLAALRYYDQPHLIREFHRYIAMTPKQFASTRTALLDAGLALRVQRKLEDAEQ